MCRKITKTSIQRKITKTFYPKLKIKSLGGLQIKAHNDMTSPPSSSLTNFLIKKLSKFISDNFL